MNPQFLGCWFSSVIDCKSSQIWSIGPLSSCSLFNSWSTTMKAEPAIYFKSTNLSRLPQFLKKMLKILPLSFLEFCVISNLLVKFRLALMTCFLTSFSQAPFGNFQVILKHYGITTCYSAYKYSQGSKKQVSELKMVDCWIPKMFFLTAQFFTGRNKCNWLLCLSNNFFTAQLCILTPHYWLFFLSHLLRCFCCSCQIAPPEYISWSTVHCFSMRSELSTFCQAIEVVNGHLFTRLLITSSHEMDNESGQPNW